ncbi:MAG TPA: choice-of-anchor P family protein [Candidatus Binatia bacterium]|nr:choice-of-anchor P family protein [Candidatus Binatia bacterium]
MNHGTNGLRRLAALARPAVLVMTAALLAAWPAAATAQTVDGAATAIRASVLGMSTALADTGPLADAQDLRDASETTAGILSLGSAGVLHAATGSSTDAPQPSVASESSLADLALSVAGNSVSAAFVMARAVATQGSAPVGTSELDGLSVNGMPVAVSGAPNQVVPLFGGRLVLNEQVASPAGTTVNALHLVVDGVADVVIASARAGIGSGGASVPPPILPPLPRLF